MTRASARARAAPTSGATLAARRRDALAARDARQAAIERHLGRGTSLVVLSLAIPGDVKVLPGSATLFAWTCRLVERVLPGARRLHERSDGLGPFAMWSAPGPAGALKARCLAVEASHPAARLVDLDVYSPEGFAIDRASMHLPPRPCLCCGEPAVDCMRRGRHDLADVVARARELLERAGS